MSSQDDVAVVGNVVSERAIELAEQLIESAHKERNTVPTVEGLVDMGGLDAALTVVMGLILENKEKRALSVLARLVDSLRTLERAEAGGATLAGQGGGQAKN